MPENQIALPRPLMWVVREKSDEIINASAVIHIGPVRDGTGRSKIMFSNRQDGMLVDNCVEELAKRMTAALTAMTSPVTLIPGRPGVQITPEQAADALHGRDTDIDPLMDAQNVARPVIDKEGKVIRFVGERPERFMDSNEVFDASGLNEGETLGPFESVAAIKAKLGKVQPELKGPGIALTTNESDLHIWNSHGTSILSIDPGGAVRGDLDQAIDYVKKSGDQSGVLHLLMAVKMQADGWKSERGDVDRFVKERDAALKLVKTQAAMTQPAMIVPIVGKREPAPKQTFTPQNPDALYADGGVPAAGHKVCLVADTDNAEINRAMRSGTVMRIHSVSGATGSRTMLELKDMAGWIVPASIYVRDTGEATIDREAFLKP